MISSWFATIEPQKTIVERNLYLNDLYDMSHPDPYTIQLQREIPKELGGGIVKSNIITVTVTE